VPSLHRAFWDTAQRLPRCTASPNRAPRWGDSIWPHSGVASRRMGSIWVESLGRNFDEALDLLADAVRDCTDELWETSMWDVPAPDANHELRGPDGTAVTDQWNAAPWYSDGRLRGAWRGTCSSASTTTSAVTSHHGPLRLRSPASRTGGSGAQFQLGPGPRLSVTSTIAANGLATR